MSNSEHSGFGGKTTVSGPRTVADPGAKPVNSQSFGDWVTADREDKENLPRPKYS